jgi:hypothetical protein
VLESRGLGITDAQRERITRRTDTGRLEQWVRRVSTVSATDELFA